MYGSAALDDLFQLLDIESDTDSTTVNGWVAEQLDRIPQTGDSFQFQDVSFLVTKAANNRAEEIRVKVAPKDADGDTQAD